MNRSDVTSLDDRQFLETYGLAASRQHRATEAGDSKAANAEYEVAMAAYRELRARGANASVAGLLSSDDPGVRLWAAGNALEFAPADGERVLAELAFDPGIVGLLAQMTLKGWREGTWSFP